MAAPVAGPLIKLALGKGKAAKAEFSLQPIRDVAEALKALPEDISLKYQGRALNKAAKPGIEALRSQVSQIGQVTGNLMASVMKLKRQYTNNRRRIPVSVVVVGFRRPVGSKGKNVPLPAFSGGSVLKGPNRAFHSWLVEYGTKSRQAGASRRNGRQRIVLGGRLRTIVQREKQFSSPRAILSSFKGRGPFAKTATGRGQYPKDFIATGTVRGAPAQHPLQKAFNQSKSQMQSVLDTEMRKALTRALAEYQRRFGDLA